MFLHCILVTGSLLLEDFFGSVMGESAWKKTFLTSQATLWNAGELIVLVHKENSNYYSELCV